MDALIKAGMKQAQLIYDLAEKYEQHKLMEETKKIVEEFSKLADRLEKLVKKVSTIKALEDNKK